MNGKIIVAGLLLIHLVLMSVLQFTAWPEMLAYPWLIWNGYRFYGDIIHPYLPLLPYMLTGIYAVLGLSITTLRLVTVVVILSADLLVWLLARVLHGEKNAFFSLLVFIPLQLLLEGNGLWFDLASLPFVLSSLYILLNNKSPGTKKILAAGVIMGFAVLVKQTNVLFIIPIFFLSGSSRKWLLFCLATFIPLALVGIFYVMTGQFPEFFFWGIWFPLFILPGSPGFRLLPTVKQLILVTVLFFPLALLLHKNKILVTGFLISLVFAFPRFAYFHLQSAAAIFSLLVPYLFSYRKWMVIYTCGLVVFLLQFIFKDWAQGVRFFEPDVQKTRENLAFALPRTGHVFYSNVPAHYFLDTKNLPVKPWADTFPWYLELPGMQERIIVSLETQKVEWVVHSEFSGRSEFELGAYRPELLDQYIRQNYGEKAKIDKFILFKRKNNL